MFYMEAEFKWMENLWILSTVFLFFFNSNFKQKKTKFDLSFESHLKV